ncbi:kinase-like protein [Calocera cornea HHB12733]|uniref:Kinase-like protein n=1 Tax=Calocera cornea HHB12733 TaxID=1353952 RepID=A0A165D8S7_9BASI|nr:kinase-like protein [Calocera cornea HHB12733]
MSDSTPSGCLWCGARRLSCDQQTPSCTICLNQKRNCTYDWTLGPHIFELFGDAADLSPKIHFEMESYQPAPSGAFACVYRTDMTDGTAVAVKVLFQNRWLPQRALQLSVREAWTWSTLHHPNIVDFMGIADYARICPGARPQLCLVSPWMTAGNIMQYLVANPTSDRRSLARDIAKGIDYLHARRDGPVVHGDLRGNNVLVDMRNGCAVACITDFGLSHVVEALTAYDTTSTTTMGNWRWLALERMFPAKYGIERSVETKTPASDVFEMMRTLLEIFTGREPFHSVQDMELFGLLQQENTPDRPQNSWIDDSMWRIMEQAWAPQRQARPSAREIRDFLKEELVSSHVVPEPNYRILRAFRSSYLTVQELQCILKISPTPETNSEAAFEFGPARVEISRYLKSETDGKEVALIQNLTQVIHPATWTELRLVADRSVKCRDGGPFHEWLNALLPCTPPWALESLVLKSDWSPTFAFGDRAMVIKGDALRELVQAAPSLKHLRWEGVEWEDDGVAASSTDKPTIGNLCTLELRFTTARTAHRIMDLFQRHSVRSLSLIDIRGSLPEPRDSHAMPAFIAGHWNQLTNLTIHRSEPFLSTYHLVDLHYGLPMLQRLVIIGQSLGGVETSFKDDLGRSRKSPWPRLHTLRVGECGHSKIIELLRLQKFAGAPLHTLLIHDDNIAQENINVRGIGRFFGKEYPSPVLMDLVSEVGWFYSKSGEIESETVEGKNSGLFWGKSGFGRAEDVPRPDETCWSLWFVDKRQRRPHNILHQEKKRLLQRAAEALQPGKWVSQPPKSAARQTWAEASGSRPDSGTAPDASGAQGAAGVPRVPYTAIAAPPAR